MEMLAQMPRSFVHRLRDIRIKQLNEAQQSRQNMTNNPVVPGGKNPESYFAASRAEIDSLIDDLS